MTTFFPKPFNVRRFSHGTMFRGVYTESAYSTIVCNGSIQPIMDTSFQALPVDRQNNGSIRIFTDSKLNVCIEANQLKGDIVEYDGKLWEVALSKTHENSLIEHYTYEAQLRGSITTDNSIYAPTPTT